MKTLSPKSEELVEEAIRAAQKVIACEWSDEKEALITDRHWAAKEAAGALTSLICRELREWPMVDTFRIAGFDPKYESTFATVETLKNTRVVIRFDLLLDEGGPTIRYELQEATGKHTALTSVASAAGEDIYNAALEKSKV